MPPAAVPRMPMYPPGAAIGQQLFYGQAPPALIPPQVMFIWFDRRNHLHNLYLQLFLNFKD